MSVQTCVRKLGFCTCSSHNYHKPRISCKIIDKLLYYNTVVALSIGYNATSAIMRRKTLASEEEVLEKSSTSEEKILI